MLIFGLCSTSVIGQVIKVDQNAKKSPLSHQKMKCLFLDYVQLLMISRAIQVMKVNRNVKKAPKSSKNEMLVFFNYIQLLMISQVIRVRKVH